MPTALAMCLFYTAAPISVLLLFFHAPVTCNTHCTFSIWMLSSETWRRMVYCLSTKLHGATCRGLSSLKFHTIRDKRRTNFHRFSLPPLILSHNVTSLVPKFKGVVVFRFKAELGRWRSREWRRRNNNNNTISKHDAMTDRAAQGHSVWLYPPHPNTPPQTH